jgi:hypothetical protein
VAAAELLVQQPLLPQGPRQTGQAVATAEMATSSAPGFVLAGTKGGVQGSHDIIPEVFQSKKRSDGLWPELHED